MKILVLGHRGMLGHMVHKYLSTKEDCELVVTNLRWPNREFKKFILSFDGDFVVNCIGAILQRTSEFGVNIDLPKWLDAIDYRSKKFKIIHPGTDCEIDDDDYGNSKREAAEYLLKEGKDTKIIKTSIIGPELKTKASLLEWFLSVKEDSINGYDAYYWNGNTTLQWSKICYELMNNWNSFDKLNIPATKCISKYDLLQIMKDVFEKNITINKNSDIKVDKCLVGNIKVPLIEEQLKEIKKLV